MNYLLHDIHAKEVMFAPALLCLLTRLHKN